MLTWTPCLFLLEKNVIFPLYTATEVKTDALPDMDAWSSVSPKSQVIGTGTDNMIVVSGSLNPTGQIKLLLIVYAIP